MKTQGLFISLLLAVLMVMPSGAWAQEDEGFYTVYGVVKDARSKRDLENVSVSVPGSSVGTVTNADGEFSLKIRNSLRAFHIDLSHIGYVNSRVAVKGEAGERLTIALIPDPTLLEELVVRGGDARPLVEEAMKRVATNYSPDNILHTGFYRETVKKGRNYINISEAILDVYKTSYTYDADYDRVQVLKGRQLLSPRASDTLVVKLQGGPNLSVFLDFVKNPNLVLDQETLYHYKFSYDKQEMIDGRAHFAVRFAPQVIVPYTLMQGIMYIDKDNLSFSRIEFEMSMDDQNKVTQSILRKKPFGLRFKPERVSYVVTYKQRDGRSYLNYIRNNVEFKCDWRRRLFATNYSIQSEMVVTESQLDNVEKIPAKLAFRPSYSLSDKVSDFSDPNFWEDYNIIEPTESLEDAVSKLKKRYR